MSTQLSAAQWGQAADYLHARGYKRLAGDCASSALGARKHEALSGVAQDWEAEKGLRIIALAPSAIRGSKLGKHQRLVLELGHEVGALTGRHEVISSGYSAASAEGYTRSRARLVDWTLATFGVGAGLTRIEGRSRPVRVWLDGKGRRVRFLVLGAEPEPPHLTTAELISDALARVDALAAGAPE